MALWRAIPGETPIDDLSGLKISGISTRRELSMVEAKNIDKATFKYLAATPTRRSAKFNVNWCLGLHTRKCLETFGIGLGPFEPKT